MSSSGRVGETNWLDGPDKCYAVGLHILGNKLNYYRYRYTCMYPVLINLRMKKSQAWLLTLSILYQYRYFFYKDTEPSFQRMHIRYESESSGFTTV
jgi:hypothetical protein